MDFYLEHTRHDITTLITFSVVHDFNLDTEKNMCSSGEAVSVERCLLSCLLILPSIHPPSLVSRAAHFHEQTMSCFKKKKKNVRKGLNGLKEARKKSTGNGLPTPSIEKNLVCFNWQQQIHGASHLIPAQLGTFIVLIPEQQRTSAFKEQPTIPECCVVAQKCCGFRVIKGLLRITTTRWPHRTYKERDKKVSKHSFFFLFFL